MQSIMNCGDDADRFLPARKVWERYGITPMTLWRWVHDSKMNFPQPIYRNGYRYFFLPSLLDWERSRALPVDPKPISTVIGRSTRK
jgi:hypothetical protein